MPREIEKHEQIIDAFRNVDIVSELVEQLKRDGIQAYIVKNRQPLREAFHAPAFHGSASKDLPPSRT